MPDSKTLKIPGQTIFADYTINAKLLNPADCNIEKFKSQKDNSVEWFDYEKLNLPLIARTRKPGDRFHPLGMKTDKRTLAAGRALQNQGAICRDSPSNESRKMANVFMLTNDP